MLAFCQWLQSTAFFTYLRGSGVAYPTILSLHMVAIAFFGAMIMLTDLRLLGVAMRNYPVADVVDRLKIPKRWGLALIVTCGLLLFSTKAEEYYYNAFFRIKMILLALVLAHALIFQKSVYRKAAELGHGSPLPPQVKAAAVLSLILWLGLVICGRGIGYIEPPLDKLHALTPPPATPAANAASVAASTTARDAEGS